MKKEKKFYPNCTILVYHIGTEGIDDKNVVKYFNKQKKEFKYDSCEVNQIFIADSSRIGTYVELLK